MDGLVEIGAIQVFQSPRAGRFVPVHHDRETAHLRRNGNRPGPAIAIGLDQSVAGIRYLPVVILLPDPGDRKRAVAFLSPKRLAGHDARPARAVENVAGRHRGFCSPCRFVFDQRLIRHAQVYVARGRAMADVRP